MQHTQTYYVELRENLVFLIHDTQYNRDEFYTIANILTSTAVHIIRIGSATIDDDA